MNVPLHSACAAARSDLAYVNNTSTLCSLLAPPDLCVVLESLARVLVIMLSLSRRRSRRHHRHRLHSKSSNAVYS